MTFIPIIIIMHIHDWYHSNVPGIHYVHNTNYNIHGAFPLLFLSPCYFPFVPLFDPFYILGTLLAVTGSVHLGHRLLVN
jgi:hypothetical protein